MTDKERFERLCKRDSETPHAREGIGTLSEKRLHRVIKSYVSEDSSSYELPVGKYVADVFKDGEIYEIQTGSFQRLLPKLSYYLEQTPYSVTVIHPVIRNKRIIRIDPETGEILRSSLSPSHGSAADLLVQLFHVRDLLPNERIKIKLLLIDAEEYRYSERVKYRRTGAYDSELFPISLISESDLSWAEDFRQFLPQGTDSFCASDYSAFIKKKGRKLYSCLNLLCSVDILQREKDGRKYIYNVK